MITVHLTAEEVNVVLQSIKNCLNKCKEGGPESDCPDCKKLQEVMVKIQTEVSKSV
ncbi:MAG: hypothetical protein M0T74_11665 [Desulfitobacterium hafniense]|nr:hypothetical protein [Desulfitobacterium hafniense]